MVEPREIVSSRIKTLLLLALCLGFVSIAVFIPDDGGDQLWRWLCGGLFALGAILAAILLVRPQRLVLDRDGFAVEGGLARSPRKVLWCDVDQFVVYRLPRAGRMIGYILAEHARREGYMADLARHLGADGTIPKTLPGSPDQIVADLNAYRAAALAG